MTHKKYLLYTSVCDNTDFHEKWISQYISYDIFINYYGNNSNTSLVWKDNINGFSKIKDWKFNALNKAYKNKQINLENYEYIAILDDDIILDKYDINACFDYMEKYELYFGCPTFKNINGNKILNNLFINKNKNKIRYTNFIDSRVCFVKSNILIEFLDNYNNELYDLGFEYLLLKKYKKIENKIGIFDKIICINPDKSQNNSNYLCNLEYLVSLDIRKENFKNLLEKNIIELFEMKVYKEICPSFFLKIFDDFWAILKN